jgi:Uma2 family endonuclease
MAEPATGRVTYEEYLAAEAMSDTKHEYLRGEVFAMASGTPTHARLAMTVGHAFGNALAARPCAVFSSDLRVRIEGTDLSTYPDLVIVCGSFESSKIDPNAVTNPTQ